MIIYAVKNSIIFKIWWIFFRILHIDGCAPPLSVLPRQDVSGGGGNVIAFPSNLENSVIRNSRVFGKQTEVEAGTPIQLDKATSFMRPVQEPLDLYCADFDEKCRWRNMEGLLVDELDWFQGVGFLDETRLRIATGTNIQPEGFYGIAATDKVEFLNSKAVLISDVIECQLGISELKFYYWTSPDVRIVICTKTLIRLYPDYDYCTAPIENNDPGPVGVTLPDLNGLPFQIYIRAENFAFHTANLQGGFAIIDNIEYFGDFCPRTEFSYLRQFPPTELFTGNFPQQSTPSNLFSQNANINNNPFERGLQNMFNNLIHPSNASIPNPTQVFIPPQFPTLIPPNISTQPSIVGKTKISERPKFITDTNERPLQLGTAILTSKQQFNPQKRTALVNEEQQNYIRKDLYNYYSNPLNSHFQHEKINDINEACYALNCSFDDHCAEYVLKESSDWELARKPVGTTLNGIRGDASLLPYNKNGKFVYAVGHKVISRFYTRSFKLPKNVYLMFSYYKVSRKGDLRMIVKRLNSPTEEVLFEAPKLVIESRRWFREVRILKADTYDYLSFEVEDLLPNIYVGIDEMVLLDENTREPICLKNN